MSRRAAALVIAGVCLAALLALGWWRFGSRSASGPLAAPTPAAPPIASQTPTTTTATTALAAPGVELPAWTARLYFPGADGQLYPETRELHSADDSESRLRALLAGVLAGPEDAALQAPLPHGVEVDAAYLAADGVAYLGLRSADRATPPSAGSQSEMTSIYSLIDSIALNLDGTKSVVLLWNGSQLESFGGHLDTSRPLAPDMSFLAKSPGVAPAPPHAAPSNAPPPNR